LIRSPCRDRTRYSGNALNWSGPNILNDSSAIEVKDLTQRRKDAKAQRVVECADMTALWFDATRRVVEKR